MPAPASSRSGKNTDKKDLRLELANRLIQQIEAGTAPWQRPWEAGEVRAPMNAVTGNPYTGVNYQNLMAFSPDPSDPRWCTYKQAQDQGWQVREGSRGLPIEVWKTYERKRTPEEIEKLKAQGAQDVSPTEQRKGVRYYTVFHASQIDGIPPLERPERNHELEGRPDPRLDVLAQNLGVSVGRGGSRAFYRPSDDHIQMPALEDFHTATGHDTTFLHEMAHATGHESRMQRDLKHAFGSEKYAIEELRAEMSAAMTAASLGIGFDPESQNVEEGREVGNAAAYLANWLGKLPEKERRDIVVQAIKDAQSISDYLIERTPELAVTAPDRAMEAPSVAKEAPQLQTVESPVIERTEDGQELRAVFWGKVNDVADIARRGIGDSEETARVKVAGILNLSTEDYDHMTANLMDDQPILQKLGGTDPSDGARYVVDVRAPERQRLLLDTQGYDYPRYVGIPEGDVERVLENRSFVVGPEVARGRSEERGANAMEGPSRPRLSIDLDAGERYVFHSDAGHGWLEVPLSDLKALGIDGEISRFSYQKGDKVFLEEDRDAQLFDDALRKALGRDLKAEDISRDVNDGESSPIRNYSRYQAPEREHEVKGPTVSRSDMPRDRSPAEERKPLAPDRVEQVVPNERDAAREKAIHEYILHTRTLPESMKVLTNTYARAFEALHPTDFDGYRATAARFSKESDQVIGIIADGPDKGSNRYVLAMEKAGVSWEDIREINKREGLHQSDTLTGEIFHDFRVRVETDQKERLKAYGKQVLKDMDAHPDRSYPPEKVVAACWWKQGIPVGESHRMVQEFVSLVAKKDLEGLVRRIGNNSQNPGSEEAFRRLTGVPLGKTQTQRVKQLAEWAGPERVRAVKEQIAQNRAERQEKALVHGVATALDALTQVNIRITNAQGEHEMLNGKDYVLAKIAEGKTRVHETREGAVLKRYMLDPKTHAFCGVRDKRFGEFLKRAQALEPSGDIPAALEKAGLGDLLPKREPVLAQPDLPAVERVPALAQATGSEPVLNLASNRESGAQSRISGTVLEVSADGGSALIAQAGTQKIVQLDTLDMAKGARLPADLPTGVPGVLTIDGNRVEFQSRDKKREGVQQSLGV